MKKTIYFGTSMVLCLLFSLLAGCEKKPLEESGGNSGGGGTSNQKGTIEGVVTAKDTDKPVLLASVMLLPADKLMLTDTSGSFKFKDIEPGTYKLEVKRNGYVTDTSEEIKVEAGKTVRYNIALESIQSQLQILDTNATIISELNVGHSMLGVFLLKNAGEEIIEWEIPKLAVDWISGFSKQVGKLAPEASDTVMLSIDRSKLQEGDNEAILYIGSSVGDKKLTIKASVERSFCFTDEEGEEILELDLSNVEQYRFKIKNTGSDVLDWTMGNIEVDWLTFVGKSDGKLEVGESESRILKVDYTKLEEGTYETDLIFSTNAGEKSLPVKIKVEMSFQLEDNEGIEISELNFGSTSSQKFKIKNTGNGILEWKISSAETDWLTLGEKRSGSLQPGDAETITVTIDRSLLSAGDNRSMVNISTNAGDKQLKINVYTEISFRLEDESGVEIIKVDLSSVDQYRFKIKNTGSDVLAWSVGKIDVDWLTMIGKSDGKLEGGESETRTLKVDRTRLAEGTYETDLIFSTNAGEKILPVRIKVEMSFRLENDGGMEISELEFGATSSQKFRIKNTGNGVLEWEISSVEADWLTLGNKKSGSLQPGATETITMTIDRSLLAVGDNRAMVNISTNAGDKRLNVNAHLKLSYQLLNTQGAEISLLDFGKTSQGSFKIKNTGDGILEWSVSSAGAVWLGIGDKKSGSLQPEATETIVVNVDRMRLSAGDNRTVVNISTNAGDKQLQVYARLDMSYQLVNAQGETVSLLDLGRTRSGQFKIENTGDGILEWELSQDDAAWLSLNGVAQGQILPNDAATIAFTIDKSQLAQGNNETVLSIHTNITGGDKQLRVKAYRLQPSDAIPEMVYVEGGTFEMGTTEVNYCGPVHNVTLYGFHISKYEITQLQWEAVMGTTLEDQQAKSNSSANIFGQGESYPMYFVSWEDAVTFCEKLSEATGETYRLPTEAEWEYAARGGQYKDGTTYAGGNNLGDVAWWEGNSGGSTHPVGQKSPNGLGLYDMSGNVAEWCSDWYDMNYYSESPAVNPQGPSSGDGRHVCRGQDYNYDWTPAFHVSYRGSFPLYGAENIRSCNWLGFRVVREL